MPHIQIYTKPPSQPFLASITIGVSRKNSNEFKNIQQTYHPERCLHTSISCYNYSKQKHRNSHKTRVSLWISVYGIYHFHKQLQTTAAEFTWTITIVKIGNQTLSNMIDKITLTQNAH